MKKEIEKCGCEDKSRQKKIEYERKQEDRKNEVDIFKSGNRQKEEKIEGRE